MRVFISHAFADRGLARQVAEVLRTSGFQVWDESQVLPGDNWGEKLGKALEESEAMVILLTSNSLQAPNVTHEIGYALGRRDFKGRVIPVLVGPPEQLPQEGIPWVLRRLNVINLAEAEPEEGLKRIAQAVENAN